MNKADLTHIDDRLIQMVAEQCQLPAESRGNSQIGLDTDIRRDLEFDSLMLVVLQIDIEDTFHIRFNPIDEDFQVIFSSIRNLSDCVKKHIEAQNEQ